MERIILFGGTFDPIHNGHLRIARYASLKLNADVVFVPAKKPCWKEPEASVTDRYNMLKLALKKEGSGSMFIDDYELKSSDEINYTINTIRYFVNKYPKHEICLLIGADQVANFDKWKNAYDIAQLAKIIYVDRAGYEIKSENIIKFHMQPLVYNLSGPVSSSLIRTLHSVDTPIEILNYIEKHELYYIKKLKKYYSPQRLNHAISVANLAYNISKSNRREESGECYIAGLLHDIGKSYNEMDSKAIVSRFFGEYYSSVPSILYHQFVSVYLCMKDFNILNEIILDAIKFHASGKANMPPTSKIVYSSDKIDPTRGYNSKKLIKACMNNYYTGFQKVLEANINFLKEKGLNYNNPLTMQCIELYVPNIGDKNERRRLFKNY